jgi:dihydropteroate synthase
MIWRFRGRSLDLTSRGVLVGIVNATPDSFSDGGSFTDPGAAADHGLRLLAEGAGILDVGGESTRPGALPVTAEEELRRVLPVIGALRRMTDAPISIDTSKAAVARAALDAGADIVNDVTALGDPEMGAVAASAGAGVILMHMNGIPATMQEGPVYPEDDALSAVAKFLSDRREAALGSGVDPDAILLDPGLGFGKTAAHNFSLLRGIPRLAALGSPLLVGHSRKSFLGPVPAGESAAVSRLPAGIAITALARTLGARVFRVHDIAPHHAALRMAEVLLAA